MKKVLLIGDSIRLSYQPKVAELLKSKAVVTGPDDNCRFSAYTLFNLPAWAVDNDYDVIQWNNGQWDTCYMPDNKIHTSLPEYLKLQERIVSILKKKAGRLIFATTTPVWPEHFRSMTVNQRKNEDIVSYNSAVTKLLAGLGVEILDLHTPVSANIKCYICDDMVHLTQEGIDLCADRVAERIG